MEVDKALAYLWPRLISLAVMSDLRVNLKLMFDDEHARDAYRVIQPISV
jgi:hypothetical protein